MITVQFAGEPEVPMLLPEHRARLAVGDLVTARGRCWRVATLTWHIDETPSHAAWPVLDCVVVLAPEPETPTPK